MPPRSEASLRRSMRPVRSSHSVISATTGCGVSAFNSVLLAIAGPILQFVAYLLQVVTTAGLYKAIGSFFVDLWNTVAGAFVTAGHAIVTAWDAVLSFFSAIGSFFASPSRTSRSASAGSASPAQALTQAWVRSERCCLVLTSAFHFAVSAARLASTKPGSCCRQ